MARLVGVDLPREKRLEIALTYVYGIGRTRSAELCTATGIDRNKRAKDLTDEEVAVLHRLEVALDRRLPGQVELGAGDVASGVPHPFGIALGVRRLELRDDSSAHDIARNGPNISELAGL